MSADNGVYILRTPRPPKKEDNAYINQGGYEYRVAHCQGIKDVDDRPMFSDLEIARHFGQSNVYLDQKEAMAQAEATYQAQDFVEYGTQMLKWENYFPNITDRAASYALDCYAGALPLDHNPKSLRWPLHVVREFQRNIAYYKQFPAKIVKGNGFDLTEGDMYTFLMNFWNNVMSDYPGDLPKDLESLNHGTLPKGNFDVYPPRSGSQTTLANVQKAEKAVQDLTEEGPARIGPPQKSPYHTPEEQQKIRERARKQIREHQTVVESDETLIESEDVKTPLTPEYLRSRGWKECGDAFLNDRFLFQNNILTVNTRYLVGNIHHPTVEALEEMITYLDRHIPHSWQHK